MRGRETFILEGDSREDLRRCFYNWKFGISNIEQPRRIFIQRGKRMMI